MNPHQPLADKKDEQNSGESKQFLLQVKNFVFFAQNSGFFF